MIITNSSLLFSAMTLYKTLLQYANSTTWSCFPSVKTIASDTNLSERTVRRQLNTLKQKKYILCIPRKRKCNGYTSNDYFLL